MIPVVLLLASLQSAQIVAPTAINCELNIVVVDPLGVSVPSATFQIPGASPRSYSSDRSHAVPCSLSLVRVSAAGFRSRDVALSLSAGMNLTLVQLEIGEIEGMRREFNATFVVKPYDSSSSCNWVRIVNLLDPAWHRDSKISARGGFGVGMPIGIYGFVLAGPKTECGSATASVLGSTDHPIELTIQQVKQTSHKDTGRQ